ncbi:MAG: TatD DNase family protein [Bacteroidetes bacterium]|nr:MAG: TatD DNase family protein [Bacteroidota bacterium]
MENARPGFSFGPAARWSRCPENGYFCSLMILTDTHTHLYSEKFSHDRAEMVQRAIDAGVSRLFLPNIDSESIAPMLQLAALFPQNCFPMMGLHPCSVDARYEDELKAVEHWLAKEKFCAVGEIGIDLYWDKTYADQQKDAFRRQILLAKKHDLAIVIHSRNAFRECFEIVSELHDENLRGVFHCFADGTAEADEVIALGNFKIGIGGVLTYKNSGLDKVVQHVGLEHIVLETDSPYLSPVPHRGKRNESAYIVHVAEKLAELKNVSLEEVAAVTTENSRFLYRV